jgi:hypothetical protein
LEPNELGELRVAFFKNWLRKKRVSFALLFLVSLQHTGAEEIANRQKCDDFDRFKDLQVQEEIGSGVWQTRSFDLKAKIRTSADI